MNIATEKISLTLRISVALIWLAFRATQPGRLKSPTAGGFQISQSTPLPATRNEIDHYQQ
jgi:hypothetical protein